MRKRFLVRGLGALSLATALLVGTTAYAEDVLLAKTKLQYKGNSIEAELWGVPLTQTYSGNLLLLFKREDGTVFTGYKPNICGGYGYTLKPVQVKEADAPTEQLLLGVRQGDWRAYTEYRILELEEPKKITELFTAVDSFGVVEQVKLEGNTLKVKSVNDKQPVDVEVDAKLLEDVSANRRRVSYAKLNSLTCLDVDRDGIDELISVQKLEVDRNTLADVGSVWRYQGPKNADKEKDNKDSKEESKPEVEQVQESKSLAEQLQFWRKKLAEYVEPKENVTAAADKEPGTDKSEAEESGQEEEKKQGKELWQHSNMTIMKASALSKKNNTNKGAFFKGGMVYPMRMIAASGEATYPQLMLIKDVERQNKLNDLLMEEAQPILEDYLRGRADLAYNVIRADKKMLTIQLISGKDNFKHHNINIMQGEDHKIELSDVLNVKSKDLVELLNVLNTNKKVTWDSKLTDEWYTRDDNLYLLKRVEDKDEVSGFALKNLKKYIKDKRFLPDESMASKESNKETEQKPDKEATVSKETEKDAAKAASTETETKINH